MRMKKGLRVLLTVCYFAAVAYITLFRTKWQRNVILDPFWEIRRLVSSGQYLHWGLQIGLNILLFVPLGFLMPAWSSRFQKGYVTVLCAMFFSVLIEAAQYLLACGLTEVPDILHNTLGAWIGFMLYCYFVKRYQRQTHHE